MNFSNPSHELQDRTCCVPGAVDCRYNCKNVFHICISEVSQPTACGYAKVDTKVFEHDDIDFYQNRSYNGLTNPLTVAFDEWKVIFYL